MDRGMQHGWGHAAWTWTHCKNMDINMAMGMDKTLAWTIVSNIFVLVLLRAYFMLLVQYLGIKAGIELATK